MANFLGRLDADAVQYESLTSDSKLVQFCDSVRGSECIAFDTEFVSEDSYRPELCLIQVAADDRLAVIDPQPIRDLTPFWDLICAPDHVTVVHASREEFLFCWHAIQKWPHRLFDTQVAAGLVGLEYPAAYGTLLSKLLSRKLSKGETRTDWRRRPLTRRQLEYAVQDVVHLPALFASLQSRLKKLGRLDWLHGEMTQIQRQLEASVSADQWRRVSGASGLSRRSLAIVRELWRWREEQAKQRNQPAKRVLRDDLIVELARRQTDDPKRIRAVRGLNYRGIQRHLSDLSDRIQQALELPDEELPSPSFRRSSRSQLSLLTQFLSTALGTICREADLAPGIVGTAQDVRDLVAHHFKMDGFGDGAPPALASGWRAEIVGEKIDRLLDGKLSIRITDPLADHPLQLEQ